MLCNQVSAKAVGAVPVPRIPPCTANSRTDLPRTPGRVDRGVRAGRGARLAGVSGASIPAALNASCLTREGQVLEIGPYNRH